MIRAVGAAMVVLASASAGARQSPPAPPGGQVAAPAGNASLTGTVSVLVDGRPSPLRRARVLVQSGGSTVRTIDTDTAGRFRADGLAEGAYKVVVDKPGFVPLGHAAVVDVRTTPAPATISVTMQRAGAIEGRILMPNGEPAMGLIVSAVRQGFGPYGKVPLDARQDTTDDLGHFRVHTLAAGEYFIDAAPDPVRQISGSPLDTAPKPTRTYFPGTPRLNDAQAFAVTAGQDISAGDLIIAAGHFAKVAVHVAASAGAPSAMTVRLQRVGAPPGDVRCWQALPGGDPDISCPVVPPGDYWVLAVARAAAGTPLEFGAARLTVENSNQAVTITTAPGVRVSGRVETAGGAPLPARLQIAALETESEFPSLNGPGGQTGPTPPVDVDASGGFVFPALAGARLLRMPRLLEGWAIAGIWLDDLEISDTPTAFSAAVKPPVVRVVLSRDTGSVSGVVLDSANRPVPSARVVVCSGDSAQWGARSRFIRTVEAGPGGRYVIDGLLPGKYFAVAVDTLDDGTWEDPDVLRQLLPAASAIEVVASKPVDMSLRIR